MSLFNRILNFSQDTVQRREQRRSQRYAAGASFPLQAELTLTGCTPAAVWAGTVMDLSAHGSSVRLPPAATPTRGDACLLHLTLEGREFGMPGTVSNLRTLPDQAVCGVELRFPEFQAHKSYLQLLEAVANGATLAPADPQFVRQDAPGLHKEKYNGEAETELILWRTAPGGPLDSFEFRMNDCFVRGSRHAPVLDIFTEGTVKTELKSGYSMPTIQTTSATAEEIRRLYRWVVPNLAPAVPEDVRDFLARFQNS